MCADLKGKMRQSFHKHHPKNISSGSGSSFGESRELAKFWSSLPLRTKVALVKSVSKGKDIEDQVSRVMLDKKFSYIEDNVQYVCQKYTISVGISTCEYFL